MVGGEPVEYIIRYTGIAALNSLIVTLLISPVARLLHIGYLMKVRRLVGLYVFFYACLHMASYFSLDLLFSIELFILELTKRPYIWLGAISFIILLVLTLTSFDRIKKQLRTKWKSIHASIYLLAIIAPIHYFMSVKSGTIKPTMYIMIFLFLLLIRFANVKTVVFIYSLLMKVKIKIK